MTHTLHPEIEKAIDKIKKEYDDYEVGEYDEGDYGYTRWLLRSIQILKDISLPKDNEPLPEKREISPYKIINHTSLGLNVSIDGKVIEITERKYIDLTGSSVKPNDSQIQ